MKHIIKSSLSCIVILTMLFSVLPLTASAANNAALKLSKTDLSVGDTLTATVTLNVSNMYSVNLSLKYNKSLVEYVSGASRAGSGTAKIVESLSGENKTTFTITFKAIAAGKATFSVSGSVGAQPTEGAMATDISLSCNTSSAGIHTFEYYSTKKATLTADGAIIKKCVACDKTTSTKIRRINSVTLSNTAYTYNGKIKTPSVTVKNSAGTTLASKYYTVTYASGRKNVGKYKVTVTFKGNYSGSKTLYFKINPPKTTIAKLTPAKKCIRVSVAKQSTQVTGYKIQYSTSKKFSTYKTADIKSYKTTAVTIKGLNRKTTYYVRVRTYKTVNGTNYYSGWSTYKYTKTN